MFHPLEKDLSEMKTVDVEQKLSELNKKYYLAARFGNQDLLTQLQTFVIIYRNELSQRAINMKFEEQDQDLDQLINVD
jgi:hypothetical protein|tara:strand:- start:845 stop:1078 length:234 start_codon:yes stop_codon:yes gene_type:complete